MHAFFWNKKYTFSIQTRPTQLKTTYFFLNISFLMITVVQNELPISFVIALVSYKILKVRNS